ncbi:MAG TPA: hypothetical protein VKU94_06260 [Geobacterales bacterium]|nr:hypothetical protein [Geobacterales bacterium]
MSFDVYELSKYPFLDSLKDFLRLNDFKIEDLLKQPNEVLNAAIEKIKSLAEKKSESVYPPDIEIKRFVLSMYIVSHLGSFYIERFAERESKKLSKLLKEEDSEEIFKIARSLISARIRRIERRTKDPKFPTLMTYAMPIKDYLKYAAYLGDYNWSLAFHEIKGGEILLTSRELVRILEEAYRQWIIIKCNEMREIYTPEIDPLVEHLSKELPLFRTRKFDEKVVYKGVDPPCMRILISDLKQGKKLSHMGNFSLAAYLRAIGYSVEETLELFKNLPDFKESVARYQIEHIYGLRGARKAYSVPSCLTLKAANLCFPESPGCDNIKHPLQYLRKVKDGRK